jgi:rfaE bifunctional protein nucleotidyltransferase chain/domain
MLEKKIKSPEQLKKILAGFRKQKKTMVFTNGCFDLLHYGHVKYLETAKSLGDILVVALNSDASVRKLKKRPRPVVKENYRAKIIAGLESVDYVVIFNEDNPLRLIKYLKPDILVKGADWKQDNIIGARFVKSYGGKVKTIKFEKGFSTTKIIKDIAKAF